MKPVYKIWFILAASHAVSAAAQDGLGWNADIMRIVREVESNNPELEARRKLRDAQGIEARMENNLEDPEVEYVHQWGRPSAAGPASELTVTQAFDFPTVYAKRAKLAEKRAAVYGHEYEAFRQQVLFEAQSLCIRVAALRQREHTLKQAMDDSQRVVDLITLRSEAGGANALEENKARFEYISAANAYKLNEIELADALNRLATLNAGVPVRIEENSLGIQAILPPYNEMAAIYETLSPDMLTAVSTLDAAKQEIQVSRSRSLPKLAVGYKRDTGPGEKLNGVVAGITIPIFSNRNNVRRAQAEAAFAEAELRRTRNDVQTYLVGLYSRAELLQSSASQYRLLLEHTDSVALLRRALDEGHISVIDYYAQLQPVYESILTMIDVMEEYHLVCAQINVVYL